LRQTITQSIYFH